MAPSRQKCKWLPADRAGSNPLNLSIPNPYLYLQIVPVDKAPTPDVGPESNAGYP